MTFAVSHKTSFGKASKSVYTPQQGIPFNIPRWTSWLSNVAVAAPPVEKVNKSSTAIHEPAKELAAWQPHNGLASSIETRWDVIQAEKAVTEEDMLEALLTLDLTIPPHFTHEITVKGYVLSAEKWSPKILDPEGFLDLED